MFNGSYTLRGIKFRKSHTLQSMNGMFNGSYTLRGIKLWKSHTLQSMNGMFKRLVYSAWYQVSGTRMLSGYDMAPVEMLCGVEHLEELVHRKFEAHRSPVWTSVPTRRRVPLDEQFYDIAVRKAHAVFNRGLAGDGLSCF